MEERLQKLLSASGLCSRRASEGWLAAGRVTVNGRTAAVGDKADPDQDVILVDGVRLNGAQKKTYILLNKPRGYVTTLADEKGRPTVADLIRDVNVRVFPVGRLDMDSEGLLLLTNDGELMQSLIHPSFQVEKTYYVDVANYMEDTPVKLSSITELDGETICRATVKVLSNSGDRARLSIVIHEGKNRQIRRMCAQCGLRVLRLQRVQEHSLQLGNLALGKWRYLTEFEISALTQNHE